jgi:hypothetical protein
MPDARRALDRAADSRRSTSCSRCCSADCSRQVGATQNRSSPGGPYAPGVIGGPAQTSARVRSGFEFAQKTDPGRLTGARRRVMGSPSVAMRCTSRSTVGPARGGRRAAAGRRRVPACLPGSGGRAGDGPVRDDRQAGCTLPGERRFRSDVVRRPRRDSRRASPTPRRAGDGAGREGRRCCRRRTRCRSRGLCGVAGSRRSTVRGAAPSSGESRRCTRSDRFPGNVSRDTRSPTLCDAG